MSLGIHKRGILYTLRTSRFYVMGVFVEGINSVFKLKANVYCVHNTPFCKVRGSVLNVYNSPLL